MNKENKALAMQANDKLEEVLNQILTRIEGATVFIVGGSDDLTRAVLHSMEAQ